MLHIKGVERENRLPHSRGHSDWCVLIGGLSVVMQWISKEGVCIGTFGRTERQTNIFVDFLTVHTSTNRLPIPTLPPLTWSPDAPNHDSLDHPSFQHPNKYVSSPSASEDPGS